MFNDSVLKLGKPDYWAPLVTWARFTHFTGKSTKYERKAIV